MSHKSKNVTERVPHHLFDQEKQKKTCDPRLGKNPITITPTSTVYIPYPQKVGRYVYNLNMPTGQMSVEHTLTSVNKNKDSAVQKKATCL